MQQPWVLQRTGWTILLVLCYIYNLSAEASPTLNPLKTQAKGHDYGVKLTRMEGGEPRTHLAAHQRILTSRQRRSLRDRNNLIDTIVGTVHARAIPMSGGIYGRKRSSPSIQDLQELPDFLRSQKMEMYNMNGGITGPYNPLEDEDVALYDYENDGPLDVQASGINHTPLSDYKSENQYTKRIPYSGALYGKRRRRKRHQIPFSGNLYGRKRSQVPFSENLYGKRRDVPISGGLYGKRSIGYVPFSGTVYGKRSYIPLIGVVYGKKRNSEANENAQFNERMNDKRNRIPFSGTVYG